MECKDDLDNSFEARVAAAVRAKQMKIADYAKQLDARIHHQPAGEPSITGSSTTTDVVTRRVLTQPEAVPFRDSKRAKDDLQTLAPRDQTDNHSAASGYNLDLGNFRIRKRTDDDSDSGVVPQAFTEERRRPTAQRSRKTRPVNSTTSFGNLWYTRSLTTKETQDLRRPKAVNQSLRPIMDLRVSIERFNDLPRNGRNDNNLVTVLSQIRTRLHDVKHVEVSEIVLIKSGIIPILSSLASHPGLAFDIHADIEMLLNSWREKDFFPRVLRLLKLADRYSSASHNGHQEQLQSPKVAAQIYGSNALVNGLWWPSWQGAHASGAHGSLQAGISGALGYKKGAYSVVLAAGQYDDVDNGDSIEYCSVTKREDGENRYTQMLRLNMQSRWPVRVLRACGPRGSKAQKSQYAPQIGIRYDGLYDVVSEQTVGRFKLIRQPGQGPIRYEGESARPTPQDVAVVKKYK